MQVYKIYKIGEYTFVKYTDSLRHYRVKHYPATVTCGSEEKNKFQLYCLYCKSTVKETLIKVLRTIIELTIEECSHLLFNFVNILSLYFCCIIANTVILKQIIQFLYFVWIGQRQNPKA